MRLHPAVVFVALSLCATNSALAQSRRPTDAAMADYHRPAPGRVTLDLASAGTPQTVVLLRRSLPGATYADGRPRPWSGSATCTTPCRVFVPPGVLFLRARGVNIRSVELDLEVPPNGAAITLRAPSPALYNLGTGFVAIGSTVLLATMVVAAVRQGVSSTTEGTGLDADAALAAVGVGGALLAAGVPLMVFHRTGVASQSPPSLAFGAMARWSF